jgi:hypothetical protein
VAAGTADGWAAVAQRRGHLGGRRALAPLIMEIEEADPHGDDFPVD